MVSGREGRGKRVSLRYSLPPRQCQLLTYLSVTESSPRHEGKPKGDASHDLPPGSLSLRGRATQAKEWRQWVAKGHT